MQRSLKKQGGALLLEGLIAILVFSLGILAIVGLQAATVRQTTDAKYRLDASFVANARIGQVWGNRAALSSFVETDTVIAALPNGKRTVAVAGNQVTVTVTWQAPGDAVVRSHTTITQING